MKPLRKRPPASVAAKGRMAALLQEVIKIPGVQFASFQLADRSCLSLSNEAHPQGIDPSDLAPLAADLFQAVETYQVQVKAMRWVFDERQFWGFTTRRGITLAVVADAAAEDESFQRVLRLFRDKLDPRSTRLTPHRSGSAPQA